MKRAKLGCPGALSMAEQGRIQAFPGQTVGVVDAGAVWGPIGPWPRLSAGCHRPGSRIRPPLPAGVE